MRIIDHHEGRVPGPGLYRMPAEVYHADPAPEPSLSSSIAKLLIDRSPEHAFHAHPRLSGPKEESDPTRPKEIGTAAHKLLLDQGRDLVVVEAEAWTTKDAKVARAAAYAAGDCPILRPDLDRQVAESIAAQDTIAENIEEDYDEHRSFGEQVSDGLAAFGGSWAFLISFALVLVAWMAVNVIMGELKAFDPYPFILLNLVLSCLAAIQAPIIMMSQSRQDKKDRLRSNNDYRVNLKAELEIRHLHEKMDHLVTKQWQRLAEIQQIQLEMLQDMRTRVARKPVVKVKKVVRKKRPKAPPPGPDKAPPAEAAPVAGAPPPGPAG